MITIHELQTELGNLPIKERLRLAHWLLESVLDRQLDSEVKNDADFFSMAGVWAERDVTQDSLRDKAWQRTDK